MLIYFSYRLLNKRKLFRVLKTYYGDSKIINRAIVMPSNYNPFKWDYIVRTTKEYIVGDINSFSCIPNQSGELTIVTNPIVEKSLKEELGRYFKSFTPFYHISFKEEKDRIIVKMTDLRYRVSNGFKHHALFYYSLNAQLISSVFHPFSMENNIEIKNNR
ncbi:hypothetical protein F8154_00940 [Alkaliphilus pronyensis]|uniref:Uncharacterized protein n=1 Tax=Alkaliphilus pronyensis TaxID=1482732 RepID=A0A6I0FLP4_9FIRM|nr:hypothetical protein [Alkaliphilus pronyensis]KAB3539033.1 hypothetical protein F8154_00940 [Alkaliphilus pronyensis]